MIIFVHTASFGQDITDESVCFLSSVGNLVNFSKSGDRQAFHHLCIAVYGGFYHFHAYTGVGYCFHSLKGFTRTSNRMN